MVNGSRPLRMDTRPLYDRAIHVLQDFIENGGHRPGDRLPSEESLARELGISRSTLREALGYLESHGRVRRRHGVGTFVAGGADDHIRAGLEQLETLRSVVDRSGAVQERCTWIVETTPASEAEAAALTVSPGDPLVRARMTLAVNGMLFAYLDSYISSERIQADDLAVYPTGSLLDYLNERDDLPVAYTHTEIHAVKAEADVAARLSVQPGESLLHLRELYFAESGQPVALSLNYFLTDTFNFHIVRRTDGRSQRERTTTE